MSKTEGSQEPVRGPTRKLIEVALPLEVINRESAHEKSVPRKGHPATLHLWWARRPLAAARAVLFAQLVDDPSSHPDRFPTEIAQRAERDRLHRIIERLAKWENTGDQTLLDEAHREILASTGGTPPPILDPFAGGGTIPLEAQRLGLEACASDLNPVAVLINKALIEIPPKFADRPPVFPGLADSRIGGWEGATGLAADVRAYGDAMRDEAARRIGEHYPPARLEDGSKATVIAWIWARTVTCPNPACGIEMPLVRSWWLGKKKGKAAWIRPIIATDPVHPSGRRVDFEIGHGSEGPPSSRRKLGKAQPASRAGLRFLRTRSGRRPSKPVSEARLWLSSPKVTDAVRTCRQQSRTRMQPTPRRRTMCLQSSCPPRTMMLTGCLCMACHGGATPSPTGSSWR